MDDAVIATARRCLSFPYFRYAIHFARGIKSAEHYSVMILATTSMISVIEA